MRVGASRWLLALGLSFCIYLVPILTVHWVSLFGGVLGRELFAERELAWKAADAAFALVLQAALFAVAWLVIPRGQGMAAALVVVLLIPATMAVNLLYLVAVPWLFLVEAEDHPDSSAWDEECSLQGYSLDPVRAGSSRLLERRGESWVRGDDGIRYGILRVPGCGVELASIPSLPIAPGLQQALADGSVVFVTMERGSAEQRIWLLPRGEAAARPLAAPPAHSAYDGPPVVSEDGRWVGWMQRSPERQPFLMIQPVAGGESIAFTDELLLRATVVPVELDMARREVVINRDLSTFVRLRLDGSVVWGPLRPGDAAAQTDTFRYQDGQWLGWDAYVEKRRYQVVWSTALGAGRYRAPKGRSITSAALDPRGRYIAVSTTSALSIGSIKDSVVVLRARDGAEVFRKTLPMYNRSQVAFLGEKYFAFCESDGRGSRVHVLRVGDAS